MVDVVVYARTSGDEKGTGQDVRAQADQVANRMQQMGFNVVARFLDDGVSGETDPRERPGWQGATAAVRSGGAGAIAILEASRFSRAHPALGLMWWEREQMDGARVVCLRESHFTSYEREGRDVGLVIVQFVTLWQAWGELQKLKERTGEVMAEITEGRRATKSGRPPGRPKKELSQAERQLAFRRLAEGVSPGKIALELSERRDAMKTTDPALRRKRMVSRQTVIRAVQNANLSKTQDGQEGGEPDALGSDSDNQPEPETGVRT